MIKAGLLAAVGGAALVALTPVWALTGDSASVAAGADAFDAKQSRKLPPGGGGRLTLGEAVEGELGRGAVYTIEGRAGQRLRAALTSDAFDTLLRIEGPDGFALENDDSAEVGALNSLIDAVLPADGTYRLSVRAYGDEGGGRYRLATMDPANPLGARGAAQPIALGQELAGTLSGNDPASLTGQFVDYFAFAGRAGQRITIDVESTAIDPTLTIYLPDGRQEGNDDRGGIEDTNSRLSLTLPEDGTYHIAASSFSDGETGRYSVRLAEAAPGVRTVRLGSGNTRVFALSVGVADYERINTLNRTDEDAERVTHALRQAGVLAPQSVTLTNAQATRANFRQSLADLTAAMGSEDLLLVFFSGHGEKVENMDTEMDGSAETIELFDAPLFDYEMAEMFADIDARTLLVIDACFAGGFDNVIDQRVERMGIFSSDSDTLSLVASGDKSGGYISHIFRQALEGGADMDADRQVTAGELSEYMRREFYRTVLETPLSTDAEDFRDRQVPSFQHLIIDRGGDGMAFGQVLMTLGGDARRTVARAD